MGVSVAECIQNLHPAGVCDSAPTQRAQGHAVFTGFNLTAVDDDKIDLREPRDRFPQRAGRQQESITVAADPIDHGDFDIPPQSIVLQTVVGNDEVTFRMRRK